MKEDARKRVEELEEQLNKLFDLMLPIKREALRLQTELESLWPLAYPVRYIKFNKETFVEDSASINRDEHLSIIFTSDGTSEGKHLMSMSGNRPPGAFNKSDLEMELLYDNKSISEEVIEEIKKITQLVLRKET